MELESFSLQDELEQKHSCLKLRSLCFLMVCLKTKARQKGVEKNKIQLKRLSGPKLFDKDHFILHTKEPMSEIKPKLPLKDKIWTLGKVKVQ